MTALRHEGITFRMPQCLGTLMPALALFICVQMGGCMVRTPPAPDRYMVMSSEPAVDARWPLRYTEPLLQIAGVPPAERASADRLTPQRYRERLIGIPGERRPGHVVHHGQYGVGVISELLQRDSQLPDSDPVGDHGGLSHERFVFAFVTTSMPPDRFARWVELEDRGAPMRSLNVTYIVVRRPLTADGTGESSDIAEPPNRPGVIVHVSSVYPDSPYEQSLKRQFLRRGWTLIEIDRASALLRDPRMMFMIDTNLGLESAARAVARNFDNRLVEWAYAAEAMFEFLPVRFADLELQPTVIVGCSLGAIATPTIVARLPQRFDAAVLIGGGANAFEVTQRSTLTGGAGGSTGSSGIQLVPINSPLTQDDLHLLYEMYLNESNFDPYHTAPGMSRLPVLVLDAMFDRIVPASTGRTLYERLARPERWSYPTGHLGLFWLLPRQSARIADWIEGAVNSRGR